MSTFGQRIVEEARKDLGKGEMGGENAGPFVEECLNVDAPRHRRTRQRWCVGAVMKWMKAANGGVLPCEFTLSSTAFKEICEANGWYHSKAEQFSPEPGDVVFVDRNGNGKPDHIYVLSEWDGETVMGIGGNEPQRVDGDPDIVKEHPRKLDRVIGYARVLPSVEG